MPLKTVYQSDTTFRVLRFTGEDFPTALWVKTDAGKELPIPTQPTAIDIGGKTLTIVSKTHRTSKVAWLDIT